jgi:hypothetical protein
MTDQELLAYEREHHGDPYMTLAKAKEMQRVALQFWHIGSARKKADREAQQGKANRVAGNPLGLSSGANRKAPRRQASGECH